MRIKDRVDFLAKDKHAAAILYQEIVDHTISSSIIAFVLGVFIGVVIK